MGGGLERDLGRRACGYTGWGPGWIEIWVGLHASCGFGRLPWLKDCQSLICWTEGIALAMVGVLGAGLTFPRGLLAGCRRIYDEERE